MSGKTSGTTVNSAILLLILGNALAMGSDIVIKFMDPGAPVFQFAFLRNLLTVGLLMPLLRRAEYRHFFNGFRIHLIRSHVLLVALVCMVVALTNLPLATANAVFYVAPVVLMVLSVVVYRESLSPLSVIAVVSGFSGVLVILRPTSLDLAAVAALGTAVCLAIGALMVRRLPSEQSTLHMLVLNSMLVLPAGLALALWEGAAWRWEVVACAAGSALFILGYNASVLKSYKYVDASQVTSAEYTGLMWAILAGWLIFGEIPDLWFIVGSLMIITPLVLIGLNQRRKRRLIQVQPVTDSPGA